MVIEASRVRGAPVHSGREDSSTIFGIERNFADALRRIDMAEFVRSTAERYVVVDGQQVEKQVYRENPNEIAEALGAIAHFCRYDGKTEAAIVLVANVLLDNCTRDTIPVFSMVVKETASTTESNSSVIGVALMLDRAPQNDWRGIIDSVIAIESHFSTKYDRAAVLNEAIMLAESLGDASAERVMHFAARLPFALAGNGAQATAALLGLLRTHVDSVAFGSASEAVLDMAKAGKTGTMSPAHLSRCEELHLPVRDITAAILLTDRIRSDIKAAHQTD